MKKNQIILISVLIFLSLVWGFLYWSHYIKPPETGALATEADLCAKFSEIKDIVSCEAARTIVLEKYPGDIKYIRRTKASLPVGVLPDIEMVEKEVWLLGINLNPPMQIDERELKGMEIFITRDSGELEINYVTSGEI